MLMLINLLHNLFQCRACLAECFLFCDVHIKLIWRISAVLLESAINYCLLAVPWKDLKAASNCACPVARS